jgi:hypothetical protein
MRDHPAKFAQSNNISFPQANRQLMHSLR